MVGIFCLCAIAAQGHNMPEIWHVETVDGGALKEKSLNIETEGKPNAWSATKYGTERIKKFVSGELEEITTDPEFMKALNIVWKKLSGEPDHWKESWSGDRKKIETTGEVKVTMEVTGCKNILVPEETDDQKYAKDKSIYFPLLPDADVSKDKIPVIKNSKMSWVSMKDLLNLNEDYTWKDIFDRKNFLKSDVQEKSEGKDNAFAVFNDRFWKSIQESEEVKARVTNLRPFVIVIASIPGRENLQVVGKRHVQQPYFSYGAPNDDFKPETEIITVGIGKKGEENDIVKLRFKKSFSGVEKFGLFGDFFDDIIPGFPGAWSEEHKGLMNDAFRDAHYIPVTKQTNAEARTS